MDWVQVYVIVIVTLGCTYSVVKNGQMKTGVVARHDWYDGFLGVLAMTPVYGRVFGYW